jgi:ribosomal protein L15
MHEGPAGSGIAGHLAMAERGMMGNGSGSGSGAGVGHAGTRLRIPIERRFVLPHFLGVLEIC